MDRIQGQGVRNSSNHTSNHDNGVIFDTKFKFKDKSTHSETDSERVSVKNTLACISLIDLRT